MGAGAHGLHPACLNGGSENPHQVWHECHGSRVTQPLLGELQVVVTHFAAKCVM